MRADTDDAVAALRRLVHASLVDDPRPPTGYSIVSTTGDCEPTPKARPLPALRLGPSTLFRSRYVERLAAAVANDVRALDVSHAPTVVTVRFAAIVGMSGAAIVPTQTIWTAGLERLLEARRLTVVDATSLAVEAGRVRGIAWSAADRATTPVDAPVVRWLLPAGSLDPLPDRRAGHVAVIARHLVASADPSADLHALVALVAGLPVTVAPRLGAPELAAFLADLV